MEHELEIQLINRQNWITSFLKRSIVQTRPFEFGLRLKNRGNSSLLGATIKNIYWKSADGQQIVNQSSKTFHLDTLNPGQEKKIWIEKDGTYAFGLCHISLDIIPDNSEQKIKTFQVNPFTGNREPFVRLNGWGNFFFIRSKAEYEQSNTNSVLYLLSFLSVLTSLLTLSLTVKQMQYSEIQSRSDRIQQARAIQSAISLCSANPGLDDSGLFDTTGSSTPCAKVLRLNSEKKLIPQ